MSRASGEVVVVGEFVALFTVQSIYTRLVREIEPPTMRWHLTATGRLGCHQRAPRPPSLSLGRWVSQER